MIKAYLFDYDGVITSGVDDSILPDRLAHNLNISPELASDWIRSIWAPFLRGDLTEDEVWRLFEEHYGSPIVADKRDIWFKWEDLKPLSEMIELVRNLKANGYPVGLLSNVTAGTMQIIRKNGGYDEFDFTVLSTEVGCKKPEPEIFNLALSKLPGVKPEEVLFLDDRKHSIAAATQIGLNAMLVSDHLKAIAEIKILGAVPQE